MAVSSQTFLSAAAFVTLIALCVQCDVLHRRRGMMGHIHNNYKDDETFTCGQSTSDKVSYFINPSNIPLHCTLTVAATDPRVTQLRLDFERFSLEQPKLDYSPIENQFPAYFCNDDTFSVSSLSSRGSKTAGITNLCGENTGQHIYVPVKSGVATDLVFNLADRSGTTPGLVEPYWRIKVTQLDCTSPDTQDTCAPEGCLQYYTDRSGQFESFNYNNGAGHYQGHLNYAICFKRNADVCSIRYDPSGFQLAANDLLTPYGPNGCNLPTTNPAEPNSQDYLFIPNGFTENGVESSYFCGDMLQRNPVSTNAPGPMYVYFRTDATADPTELGNEAGFQMKYGEGTTACDSTRLNSGTKG